MNKMTKRAYMAALEQALESLPTEEREAALTYYEEFFAEAGSGQQEQVMEELGPPDVLAEGILAEANFSGKSSTPYVPMDPEQEKTQESSQSVSAASQKPLEAAVQMNWESAQSNGSPAATATPPLPEEDVFRQYTGGNNLPARVEVSGSYRQNDYQQQSQSYQTDKKGLSGWKLALVIALLILFSPVIIGLAGGLFGGFVGILGGLIGLIVGVAAMALGGLSAIVVGIGWLSVNLGEGLAAIGSGLVVSAAGLFLSIPLMTLLKKGVPAFFRWTGKLLSKLWKKIKGWRFEI